MGFVRGSSARGPRLPRSDRRWLLYRRSKPGVALSRRRKPVGCARKQNPSSRRHTRRKKRKGREMRSRPELWKTWRDPISCMSGNKSREVLVNRSYHRSQIVIGTVEGDVHSIGKDLVGSFLFSNGFEILNLGEEVPASVFVEKAEEFGAQVIGLSSLITMSMGFQREVIEELTKRGLRNKYKVIIGGSPTSVEYADEIGADGWADDAIEAVALVKKLLNV